MIGFARSAVNRGDIRQVFPEEVRRRYLRRGLRTVEGWLNPLSALMISHINAAQTELGVRGGVGEIGVHHGKLFILLHLMLREGERSFALDVFERQDLNVDQSGRGDRERFLESVQRWAGRTDLIDIFADSSENITAEQIIKKSGRIRIFSVDGGHTEALTLNDLRIADQVLCDGGIVIVDDYFNAHWPDVSCGMSRFIRETATDLRPLLICPNKVVLCRSRFVERYQPFFLDEFRYAFLKSATMYRGPVLIFDSIANLPNRWQRRKIRLGDRLRRTPASGIYKRIAATPIGRALAPIVHRVFP